MKRILFILIFFCVIGSFSIYANDSIDTLNKKYQIELGGSINYGYYLPNFSYSKGIIDCDIFQIDKYSGYSIFTAIRFPIKTSDFEAGINLGYSKYSGKILKNNSFPFYDRFDDKLIDLTTETVLESDFQSISINPFISYKTLADNRLNLIFRPNIYYILSNNYDQYEQIISPDNAVFINYNNKKTQRRELSKGEFQSLNNLNFAISTGIEFEIMPKSNIFSALSRLMFVYQITDYLSDASWKKAGLSLELALSYNEYEKRIIKYQTPTIPPIPNLPEFATSLPKPILEIIDIIFDGKVLKGKELLATAPLITSVFFKQNSAEIDKEYLIYSEQKLNLLKADPIIAHYHILPELAYILNENKNASVIVKGYTSGLENEPQGIELSRSRAESVKKALLSLGVSENQVKIETSILPRNPSNMAYQKGIEENQRVDLELIGAKIRKYVDLVKFSRWKGNTKIITKHQYLSNQTVKISNSLTQDTLSRLMSDTIDIPLSFDFKSDSMISSNIYLNLVDISAESSESININDYPERIIEKSLANFRAILNFDYNSSEISHSNKELLSQMIEKLPDGCKIKIYGSADELGTVERNKELSKQRAMKTKEYIESYENINFEISIDINRDKFPESTPQGRFLNRSIIVKIDDK